jgi:hypothetical protein
VYLVGGYGGADPVATVVRLTLEPEGHLGTPVNDMNVTLAAARVDHTAVATGNGLYVIGGNGIGGRLATVERAPINADGALGTFATIPGVTLTAPRQKHTTAAFRGWVYVIGGSNGSILTSVERASIAADGSLSTFANVSGVALTTGREFASTFVAGNDLYVIGGYATGGQTATVERAFINPDGTISSFQVLTGIDVFDERDSHRSFVVGNSLYLIGGFDNLNRLTTVERATIAADGAISAFTTVSGTVLNNRREAHGNVILGNVLYVLGGYSGTLLAGVETNTLP